MPGMSSRRTGKQDILQQRIPENPRYKNVKPTVDTGASLSKHLRKIEEIKQNYKFQKDEIFKRMKITTFVQLVVQVNRVMQFARMEMTPSEVSDHGDHGDEEPPHLSEEDGSRDRSPDPSLCVSDTDYGRQEMDSARSTLLGVARGVGEMDLNAPHESGPSNPNDTCPYLLLDIRDNDDYQKCHILTALSYPKATLSRSVNFESKEMLLYKNRPGKIVVVYDEDERLAHVAATTLAQRGYDNLFMLSGGLKVASKLFPEGLVCGRLPETITGKKPTKNPPLCNYHHPGSFCDEDIDKIDIYLDNALQDHSIGSRLSKAGSSRATSRSSARSTASSTVPPSLAGRPSFKP